MTHMIDTADRPHLAPPQATTFLRRVLLADAVTSAACGVAMAAGAGTLDAILDLPTALLRYAGLVLLPFAALVALLATRQQLARPAAWAVIAANGLWAAESILLLFSGWVAPNALGIAFVVAQAAVVAAFAELEYVGLRRMSASAE